MKKISRRQSTQVADQRRKTSDAKYSILLEISRNYRQCSPSLEDALDSLLEQWLHGVPSYVDMRPLHIALQSGNIDTIGAAVYRLCDECEVMSDER